MLLAVVVANQLKNFAFPLAIAWAFWGIYQALTENPQATMAIKWTALIGIGALIILAGYTLYKNRWQVSKVTY